MNFAYSLASSTFPSPILLPIMIAEPFPSPKKITHKRRETVLTILKAAYWLVPILAKIKLCVVIPKDQIVSSITTGNVTIK